QPARGRAEAAGRSRGAVAGDHLTAERAGARAGDVADINQQVPDAGVIEEGRGKRDSNVEGLRGSRRSRELTRDLERAVKNNGVIRPDVLRVGGAQRVRVPWSGREIDL